VATPPTVRVCTPDEKVNLNGHLIVTCRSVVNELAQIDVPLNPIFKGYDRLDGTYLVYLHLCTEDEQKSYGVGTTCMRVSNY